MTPPLFGRWAQMARVLDSEAWSMDHTFRCGMSVGAWTNYRDALVGFAYLATQQLQEFLALQQRHALYKQEVTGKPAHDGRERDDALKAMEWLDELIDVAGRLREHAAIAVGAAGAPPPPGSEMEDDIVCARNAAIARDYLYDLEELEAQLKGEPPTGGYVRPGTVLPPRDGFVGVAMNSAAPGQTVNVLVNGTVYTRKTAKALAASVGAAVKAGDIVFHKDIQMPGRAPAPKQKGKRKKR